MVLWYVQDGVAHYHLGACDADGYRHGAFYGMFDASIRHFAEAGLHWLDLGGSAGTAASNADGLARFKAGWSNGARTAFLGGRIADPSTYRRVVEDAGREETDYFPAYRVNEYR
jgi:lipid II:glycine glycyltransferase (peptidoglycan interpeptide bridge formation enzyme)